MIRFNIHYFLWACLIFFVEVAIALFVHDSIIRPYIGDMLVVILIYCFVKSFLQTPILPTAIGVLIFAYFVEFLQYIQIIKYLGLENNKLASIVIGTSFSWGDLTMYTLGIGIVLLVEKKVLHHPLVRKT